MAFVHRGLDLCQGATLDRSLFLPGMGMNSKFPRREQRRRTISLVPISQKKQDSDRHPLGRRLRTVVPEKPSWVVVPDKPVQFEVKAIVTVRRKRKEALREAIEKHVDSFLDAVGSNIVLQLVSEKIDPSMVLSLVAFD